MRRGRRGMTGDEGSADSSAHRPHCAARAALCDCVLHLRRSVAARCRWARGGRASRLGGRDRAWVRARVRVRVRVRARARARVGVGRPRWRRSLAIRSRWHLPSGAHAARPRVVAEGGPWVCAHLVESELDRVRLLLLPELLPPDRALLLV